MGRQKACNRNARAGLYQPIRTQTSPCVVQATANAAHHFVDVLVRHDERRRDDHALLDGAHHHTVLEAMVAAAIAHAELGVEQRAAGDAYFARFNPTSAVPPPVEAGVLHVSSSPVTVTGRVCSVPFQFGKVLVSMWNVMVLFVSSTV